MPGAVSQQFPTLSLLLQIIHMPFLKSVPVCSASAINLLLSRGDFWLTSIAGPALGLITG